MKALVLLSICIVVTSFSGCTMFGGGGEKVSAKDNMFEPNTMSIKQNVEITWTNDGQNLHAVAIHKVPDPVTTTKKNDELPKGTSTSYKFEETGTFHVYCKYHSGGAAGTFNNGMVMTITVTA